MRFEWYVYVCTWCGYVACMYQHVVYIYICTYTYTYTCRWCGVVCPRQSTIVCTFCRMASILGIAEVYIAFYRIHTSTFYRNIISCTCTCTCTCTCACACTQDLVISVSPGSSLQPLASCLRGGLPACEAFVCNNNNYVWWCIWWPC